MDSRALVEQLAQQTVSPAVAEPTSASSTEKNNKLKIHLNDVFRH